MPCTITRKWSSEPPTAIFVAIDGTPIDQVWQTMTATDGPTLPQVAPLYFSMLHAINDS